MATIGTIDHDFVLPNHDICQQLGCPLKPNVPYAYHNSMFVSPTYPSVCKHCLNVDNNAIYRCLFSFQ